MEIFHKMISRVELFEWAYKIQILKKGTLVRECTLTVEPVLTYLHGVFPDARQSCIIDRLFPLLDCDLEVIVPCYNWKNM